MQTKLVVMPRDSMWWIVRPEFVAFLDKIVMDKSHFAFEKDEKDRSGFHRLAWDRLNVLGDTGLLELRDLGISDTDVKSKADRLLLLIQSNAEWLEQFCNDLAFGYQYWIDFNQMKIDLLPNNEEYIRLIRENMGTWLADLQALQQRGKLALEERPAILEYVGRNVLEKVVTLDLLASKHGLCPLSALKEYEPFVKWLYAEFENPSSFRSFAEPCLWALPE